MNSEEEIEISKKDFTSTKDIKNIKGGNPTIEIIGYVTNITSNQDNRSPYKRIIINNGDGVRIQVTAWRELKSKLEEIEIDGTVVHLTSLLSTYPKNPEFKNGTEPIELLVRQNTDVMIYGRFFDAKDSNLNPTKVELENIAEYIDKKVKVEGFVKTVLGKFTTKDSVFTAGCICDGKNYKIEVKSVLLDVEVCKLQKGRAVEVTGTVKKYGQYPPFIQFTSKLDYKNQFKQIKFRDILKCYENVK